MSHAPPSALTLTTAAMPTPLPDLGLDAMRKGDFPLAYGACHLVRSARQRWGAGGARPARRGLDLRPAPTPTTPRIQ
jgi:hypothetical protein